MAKAKTQEQAQATDNTKQDPTIVDPFAGTKWEGVSPAIVLEQIDEATAELERAKLNLDREYEERSKELLQRLRDLEEREAQLGEGSQRPVATTTGFVPAQEGERPGAGEAPICDRCSDLTADPPVVVRMVVRKTLDLHRLYWCPNKKGGKCLARDKQVLKPEARKLLAKQEKKQRRRHEHPPIDDR